MPHRDDLSPTRRTFLAHAGALAAAASATPALPHAAAADPPATPEGVRIPEWVFGVTRMAFLPPGDVPKAARAGAQVVHTNLVWPYYPLRRDGGGLSREDARRLRDLVSACRRACMKIVLGLPPFPPVALLRKHPDWRVHPAAGYDPAKVVPREDDLGTRLGCNLGRWGDYLIEVCGELVEDYKLDGVSFDGNYHPPICFCPACKSAYTRGRKRPLPAKADLDDVAYREYLVWRGERLENHYRRLQQRIKKANPDAVLMSWTVNAGRYGHFLYSPRAMPTRLNRLFDLPMQEWWLDETNLGASLAPAFGAAYLRATAGGGPCASEPYLMSRGNPPGTDSFPTHERLTRCLLAVSRGNVLAESLGWPGHETSAASDFREVARRAPYLTRAADLPWCALLVSEQTRQFHAYKDIPDRFLSHVLGAFRAATEEHLPLALVNDWDLDARALSRYAVVVLANAAALSDAQVGAVRDFVRAGGGLVATGEASLCDELGRPRRDFALAELFGVSYRGDGKRHGGPAVLTWKDHPLVRDARLRELVPRGAVNFRGPLVRVSEPKAAREVAVRIQPEGAKAPLPAAVLRRFGAGRVAYFPAGVDSALWAYAYPYQRRLLARAIEWAARVPAPVSVRAPMCVQATYFTQPLKEGRRVVVHLFNGVNTTANHGLPAADVPLREEVVPVHGIEVRFHTDAPKRFRGEPGGRAVKVRNDGGTTVVEVPPVQVHLMLVGEA
jgi:hypothetical protein